MSIIVIGLNKSDAIIIKVPGYEPIKVRIAESEPKKNVRLVIEAQSEIDVGRLNKSKLYLEEAVGE